MSSLMFYNLFRMADLNLSESEEMYLVSIAREIEAHGEGPVPVSDVARALGVQPVSANQMVRKLEDEGRLCYTPYKGVEFTPAGRQQALQILRRHRLWEVFLVEHLKLSLFEADAIACRLEHIFPPLATERLAGYLGFPVACPSGKPIPAPDGNLLPLQRRQLTSLLVGEQAEVQAIEADSASRAFLSTQGLAPGESVAVTAIGGQGALLLRTAGGQAIHLSPELAATIWVKPD